MINNLKIWSSFDFFKGLRLGIGKFLGIKAVIIFVFDMLVLFYESIDFGFKLFRFYFSFSIYLI